MKTIITIFLILKSTDKNTKKLSIQECTQNHVYNYN